MIEDEEIDLQIVDADQDDSNQVVPPDSPTLGADDHHGEAEAEAEPSVRNQTQDNGDSGNICTICMCEWTIGSDHRVCCLNCGHLFGRSCIERWIKEKGSLAKCPNCNKAAKRSQIRDLWCKSITAVDNSDVTQLTQLLENERKLRKTDSARIFQKDITINMLEENIEKLKKDNIEKDRLIGKLKTVIDNYNRMRQQKQLNGTTRPMNDDENSAENLESIGDVEPQSRDLKGLFLKVQIFESSHEGGCRSIAISPTACVLLVSQPSPTRVISIFERFGLRKYYVIDTNHREFIPLHSSAITGMELNSTGNLIITTGMDRKIKITSLSNNLAIQNYTSTYEPVAVSWSNHHDQQFYTATINGFVYLYDMRNTSEYLCSSSRKIATTRPLSLKGTTNPNGMLMNDARGAHFIYVSDNSNYDSGNIDRQQDHFKHVSLPFDGLMGSVDYDPKNNLALISSRRSQVVRSGMHHLLQLHDVTDPETSERLVKCENVKSYSCGQNELLSQSRILKHPTLDNGVLVGASDSQVRGIKLWDSSDNTEYQTIKTNNDFIRDMAMFTPQNTNQHLLYTLGDRNIGVYRWDYA